MSLLSAWGNKESRNEEDMSTSKLSVMNRADQSSVFFESLRSGDIAGIRNLLQVNRSLLNDKMYGFEGHDVYGSVPEVKLVVHNFLNIRNFALHCSLSLTGATRGLEMIKYYIYNIV